MNTATSSFVRRLAAFLIAIAAPSALAQSTIFTYQGELRSGSLPTSGLHDFRFRLYDAATGGTPLGAQQCANNVPVTNGKFSTPIDFGQHFASTAPRYLEIDVRADFGAPCTDVFAYVTLTPRQLIVPAPRAQVANAATALVTPDASLANAFVVDNDGKVGIGTAAPVHSVTIAKPQPTLALHDTDSSGGSGGQQVGYLSYRDNANVERAWVGYGSTGDPDLSIISARNFGDIVLNTLGSGKVGIGTTSPLSTLDVRGEIRYGSAGQYFPLAADENLRVIRGTVNPTADCAVTPPSSGTGFTVTNLSCGEIRINFSPQFAATPVVFASAPWINANGGEDRFATCSTVSPAGASIRVFLNSSGNNVRSSFQFIAIGRR